MGFRQRASLRRDGGGPPVMSVTGTVSFGSTLVGTPSSQVLTISNTGGGTLTIGARSYPSGFSESAAPGSLSLAAGQSTTFTVQATSSAAYPAGTVYGGNISIANNSASSPKLVAVTATVEVSYALHESFSSGSFAAGTRTAIPGGGSIAITDPSTKLSLDNDVIKANIVTANVKLVDATSRARAAGLAVSFHSEMLSGAGDQFGFASNNTGTTIQGAWNGNNGGLRINPGFAAFDNILQEAPYWRTVVARAAGELYFIQGGKWGHKNLAYIRRTGSVTPLYAFVSETLQAAERYERLTIPTAALSITPIVSDDFNRADGAIGTSDSYEGGTNTAWSSAIGTANVISNAAGFSALSGGIGVALIEAGTKDVAMIADATRSAGNVGLVLRHDGVNNFLIAYHDGTLAHLAKVLGGAAPVDIVTKSTPFVANAGFQAYTAAEEVTVLYNDVALATTPSVLTDAALLTGTKFGIYSTDTGNRLDNFVIWPRGTGGEYDAYLNAYTVRIENRKKHNVWVGDSIIAGQGVTTSFPYQTMDTLTRSLYASTNSGVTGKTAAQMVADFSYRVAPLLSIYDTTYVEILAGSNDLAASATASAVLASIDSLVSASFAAGANKVVLMTILKRSTIGGANETARQTVNTGILARHNPSGGVTVVDIAANANFQNTADTTYYLDGVHPTTLGNTIIAGMLAPVIAAL